MQTQSTKDICFPFINPDIVVPDIRPEAFIVQNLNQTFLYYAVRILSEIYIHYQTRLFKQFKDPTYLSRSYTRLFYSGKDKTRLAYQGVRPDFSIQIKKSPDLHIKVHIRSEFSIQIKITPDLSIKVHIRPDFSIHIKIRPDLSINV